MAPRHAVTLPRASAGFTLLELAIAMFIIALLVGSLLIPLQKQVENRNVTETQRSLDRAIEALQGFVTANGRLPCPASAVSNGIESPVGGGSCTNPYNGFLPAVTLGIGPTDTQGYMVDGWGTNMNRIRYAVAAVQAVPADQAAVPACTSGAYVFTTTSAIKNCWPRISGGFIVPNLTVCSTATGIAGNNCAAGATLTSTAVALVYSVGGNAANGGTGADEAQNPNPNSANNDRVFVWHGPSDSSAANGEFDDLMQWLSVNVLYSKLISAGLLP